MFPLSKRHLIKYDLLYYFLIVYVINMLNKNAQNEHTTSLNPYFISPWGNTDDIIRKHNMTE